MRKKLALFSKKTYAPSPMRAPRPSRPNYISRYSKKLPRLTKLKIISSVLINGFFRGFIVGGAIVAVVFSTLNHASLLTFEKNTISIIGKIICISFGFFFAISNCNKVVNPKRHNRKKNKLSTNHNLLTLDKKYFTLHTSPSCLKDKE